MVRWSSLLAMALALAAAAERSAAAEPLAPPPGYRLVWADEFERDGLPDPARWLNDTAMNKAGWHNRELQYYSAPRAENAVVAGGRLRITARREALREAPDWGGQAYTSARLITRGRGEWTYGFFEVRARLPCGRGLWPAIWMLNRAERWPDGGELDILEHVGKEPDRIFSTVHTAAGHAANGTGNARRLETACSAFHDYQLHWTPDSLRFGVDGAVHFEYRRDGRGPEAWPFDAPQYLILNVAIGGWLGGAVDDGVFPATMEIEHVRVYQAPR